MALTDFLTAYCKHGPGWGCMYCCDNCNYDRHRCHGCGTPLAHGVYTCSDCDRELKLREE